MKITKARLKKIVKEELTRSDKTEIKKMIEKELEKLLKKKETKEQIADLTKKIMKKLYKDLSLEHPYIIDRIKVQCYISSMRKPLDIPRGHQAALEGDWIRFKNTKLTCLVKKIDRKTGMMQVECFEELRLRWFTHFNYGQYIIL